MWGATSDVVTDAAASVTLWNGATGDVTAALSLADARTAGDDVGSVTVTGPVDAPSVGAHLTTDIPDPIVWLTWVAAHTTTLNLGTGILILPQRNPLVLAKSCATLDVLSRGRLRLGIGVGWLEEEFDALGIPFAKRGARTEEYVAVMQRLWDDEKASFDGDLLRFSDCISRPSPVNGRVPVIVGGHSDVSARRAGRIGDGFFPGKGDNDRLRELIGIMRASAEEAGRDPDAIEITTGGAAAFAPDPVEALGELAELGVSRVVIPPLSFDPTAISDVLTQLVPKIRRRGLLVLISDCFDEVDNLVRALGHFRHARNDVIVFQIWDRDELEFPFRGRTQFRSLELASHTRLLDSSLLRKSYLENLQRFRTALGAGCSKQKIDLISCTTDEPHAGLLAAYLAARGRGP